MAIFLSSTLSLLMHAGLSKGMKVCRSECHVIIASYSIPCRDETGARVERVCHIIYA